MNLVIRKNRPELLSFSLQRGFRVFFFLSAVIIGFFLITIDSEGKSNLGPIFVIIFCLFCGGYYELWIFDRERGKIEQRYGFFFLFKRNIFSIKDLKQIEISSFTKGKTVVADRSRNRKIWQKKYSKLVLVSKTGVSSQIEMAGQEMYEELKRKGELISQLCGVELVSLA